jgi:hypothetical protein
MGFSKSFHIGYARILFRAALMIHFPATDRPLRDAEANCAEMPREMLNLGDWLIPMVKKSSLKFNACLILFL